MKFKTAPYSKIKELICKPITKKDVKLFAKIHPVLFNKSIAEQEKMLEERIK